jgi:myo-inositol-hexaphosphate 3-phosphohydrolase
MDALTNPEVSAYIKLAQVVGPATMTAYFIWKIVDRITFQKRLRGGKLGNGDLKSTVQDMGKAIASIALKQKENETIFRERLDRQDDCLEKIGDKTDRQTEVLAAKSDQQIGLLREVRGALSAMTQALIASLQKSN